MSGLSACPVSLVLESMLYAVLQLDLIPGGGEPSSACLRVARLARRVTNDMCLILFLSIQNSLSTSRYVLCIT